MNKTNTASLYLLALGIPLTIVVVAIWIATTTDFSLHPNISLAITLDLLLTAPLAYFLIAWRKKLPKFTTISFLIIGIILASSILPKDQQTWLEIAKFAIAPIEIGVFAFLFWKTFKLIKTFRIQKEGKVDFLSTFLNVTKQVLGNNMYAYLITYEVAFFYYGIIKWRKSATVFKSTFTYHQKNGVTTMYMVMLGLFAAEAFVVHLLIAKYSEFWAIIATGFSVYAIFQIIGHLKAIHHRPILLEEDALLIRYGLAGDVSIPFEEIKAVSFNRKTPKDLVGMRKLAGELQPHNIVLELSTQRTFESIYGIQKSFQTLLFYVDEAESFIEEIQEKIVG